MILTVQPCVVDTQTSTSILFVDIEDTNEDMMLETVTEEVNGYSRGSHWASAEDDGVDGQGAKGFGTAGGVGTYPRNLHQKELFLHRMSHAHRAVNSVPA
eukprot:CAMPEP_0113954980 /NCGR_PEP_ID=MMETSP0011_2-20120614/986_1 /TAXON_ID=101924 /ORGANISM="Rhodosorus marinus" /LENGTH=99 /DNA_ID=CAMNT_0000964433 /DNA_START=1088 /DNA_END=1387 /DNA_ORIENTATION=+ /assembly_acc=CAM_ASM_000156